MKDQYGNTTTDTVINLTYLRSTLDQINFDGAGHVSADKITNTSGYGTGTNDIDQAPPKDLASLCAANAT